MATFSQFLKSIYRDGNDGKQFERFVKWFLTHDPKWKTQVEEAWLWDDWPDRWGPDKGIDLVFRHRDGDLWAVQAKCYDEKYDVTKTDVDKFLSESGRKVVSKRLLITTTNKLGTNAKEVCAGQEKPVMHFMLSDFEKAAVNYPRDCKNLHKVKKKEKPKPEGKYEYQNTAVKAVVKGFKNADRGQLIMACGTGKTFTTLWVKERMNCKNTLVLLPSLNLLAQTVREWSFASKSQLDIRCVCSDKSVGKKSDDEVIQSVSNFHFPVYGSNEIKKLRKFMREDGEKVIFSTYQSAELIVEAQKGRVPPFDLVVADEAHRCATSGKQNSPFRTVLDEKKIKATKRLFATATPRTYTPQVKKAAKGRGVTVVGMDDEKAFGKPFHTLTFGEAINNDPPLLTDYQVVIVGVDDKMVSEWIEDRELVIAEGGETVTDAETLATQIGLLKAMNDYGLKRVISFHSLVKRAENFSNEINDAIGIIKKRHRPKGTLKADFVSGGMSTFERGQKLNSLKNIGKNEIGLLSNARCLSEGVDVPSLDGVAFIDPKNSQVDIIQAVGRAIRLSGDKSIGTIILPVFIKDGEDASTTIEESQFKPIWWVLNALRAHDDALAEEISEIRTDKGKKPKNPKRRGGNSKVELDVPESVGSSFASSLKTEIVKRTNYSFDVTGLLSTKSLSEKIGFRSDQPVHRLVRSGRIVPAAKGLTNAGISSFFHPDQAQEIIKLLGINITDTKGLISENKVRKLYGISRPETLRKHGELVSCGTGIDEETGQVCILFETKEIEEYLKKKYPNGILENDGKLLTRKDFMDSTGLSNLAKYENEGLISPVGMAKIKNKIYEVFHPNQEIPLLKKLGVTLFDTKGLVPEPEFSKTLNLNLRAHRNRGTIKPEGFGWSYSRDPGKGGLRPYYDPKKKHKIIDALGITLTNTDGLISEPDVRKKIFGKIGQYRLDGKIVPDGFAYTSSKLSAFYSPETLEKFKKSQGITLDTTDGLVSEKEMKERTGVDVAHYRRKGIIIPTGYVMGIRNLSAYYRPEDERKIRLLKK